MNELSFVTPPLIGAVLVFMLIPACDLVLAQSQQLWHTVRPRISIVWTVAFCLLILTLGWRIAAALDDYSTWFVAEAYPYIDWSSLALLLTAVLLLTWAHLARLREVALEQEHNARSGRLLETLHMLRTIESTANSTAELLQQLLIRLLPAIPATAGAVLIQQKRSAAPIMGASFKLEPKEIALLEAPHAATSELLSTIQTMQPRWGADAQTAFPGWARTEPFLLLPIGSPTDPLGAVVIFFDAARSIEPDHALATTLQPVANWLSQRLQLHKLMRDVRSAQASLQLLESQRRETTTGLRGLLSALQSAAPNDAICRAIAQSIGGEEGSVIESRNDTITVSAGSNIQVSAPVQAALCEALERQKPVLVNQESVIDGQPYIAVSNLVIPFNGKESAGLLIRRSGQVIDSGEHTIALAEQAAMLLELLQQTEAAHADTRLQRRGLEKLLGLLQPHLPVGHEELRTFVASQAHALFPNASVAVIATRVDEHEQWYSSVRSDGLAVSTVHEALRAVSPVVFSTDWRSFNQFEIRRWVEESLPAIPARQEIAARLGGMPFAAVMPFTPSARGAGLICIAADISAADTRHWEAFLRLWHGLLHVRLTFEQPSVQIDPAGQGAAAFDQNHVNNLLASIIGSAELLKSQLSVAGPAHQRAVDIIVASEQLTKALTTQPTDHSATRDGRSIPQLLEEQLAASRIAGDLYMLAGRPREISIRSTALAEQAVVPVAARQLLITALNRFVSHALDEDALTISSYLRDEYIYVDICRHRRNFPPIDELATMADYRPADRIRRERPGEPYLTSLEDLRGDVAIDAIGSQPAYLSFRLKLDQQTAAVAPLASGSAVRILAIDDQPIILDLIAAMCQALGCTVDRAASGSEGIRLAQQHRYDLVLTDLSMPDLSGLEVARRIREFRPGTPIVLVTGFDKGLSSDELRRAGIRELLRKPFRIEQLTDLIKQLVPSLS